MYEVLECWLWRRKSFMLTKGWLISPAAIHAHGGREQSILTSQGTFRSVNSQNIPSLRLLRNKPFCWLKEHSVLSTQGTFCSVDSRNISFCRLKEYFVLLTQRLFCSVDSRNMPLCQSVCLPLCLSVCLYANMSPSVPIYLHLANLFTSMQICLSLR